MYMCLKMLIQQLRILGSMTQNTLLNLTVKGYRGDSLIFTNTTALSFSPRNVSTFIQMDRSRYQPGETIKVRIVSVQLDNHPYRGSVDVSIQVDPCVWNKGRGVEWLLSQVLCGVGRFD